MIEINQVFAINRDKYQWVLIEKRPPGVHPVTGETGNGEKETRSYHSNFAQAMQYAAAKSCEGVATFEALAEKFQALTDDIDRAAAAHSDTLKIAIDAKN